jgi:hypothetical protein
MRGTVVSYERFLEIRQRRNRVTTKPTVQPVQTMIEEVLDHHAVLVDCTAPNNEECGTRCLPVDPTVPTASTR